MQAFLPELEQTGANWLVLQCHATTSINELGTGTKQGPLSSALEILVSLKVTKSV